ncbi:uncharacterized protein LTR77_002342 [Saxophila tyrrhenica]|uniref:DUF4470 domain-containing protein n=1 Tax=Saxophila tyrrhenica TaxID=1690608 RepID=A0AAV9PK21_9PEZI|nr:hypothetical protein LTR77_002342 [Saxophila tyrrhenica]
MSELMRTMQTSLEYYVFGRDTPESLYDADVLQANRNKVTMMFAGIGDARNLHASLVHIAGDKINGKLDGKLFHVTLVDIKPAVIARDIVNFLLLDGLSGCANKPASGSLLACLYYTYLAPVMPARLYEVLQEHIQSAVDILEDRRPLPKYLDIPHLYRAPVLKVLKEWQHDASAEYPRRQQNGKRSFLPFGLTTPLLPAIDTIRKYRVVFKNASGDEENVPVFVLAFFVGGSLPLRSNIRPFLLSDEKADSAAKAKQLREEGSHIVSTWSWSKSERSATFWLRKDAMDQMQQQGNWELAIWRTDNWLRQGSLAAVRDVIDTGDSWTSTQ